MEVMDDRTKARIKRINDEVDVLQLLEGYGFRVRVGMDREQQFPCSLHGTGQDLKPSARVYPDTNSWYCWACAKSRDVIETVREKEGLGFMEAVAALEQRFNLPALPYEPSSYRREATGSEVVAEALSRTSTFEDDERALRVMLQSLTTDRDLPLNKVVAFWEAFDKVMWLTKGKHPTLTLDQGRVALEKLRQRILLGLQPA